MNGQTPWSDSLELRGQHTPPQIEDVEVLLYAVVVLPISNRMENLSISTQLLSADTAQKTNSDTYSICLLRMSFIELRYRNTLYLGFCDKLRVWHSSTCLTDLHKRNVKDWTLSLSESRTAIRFQVIPAVENWSWWENWTKVNCFLSSILIFCEFCWWPLRIAVLDLTSNRAFYSEGPTNQNPAPLALNWHSLWPPWTSFHGYSFLATRSAKKLQICGCSFSASDLNGESVSHSLHWSIEL